MIQPKISIITPSYNQGVFLERTILSILNQDYPNLEFIIVDGGSTDNSVEIIKKYQDRITYWVSEKDKGTFEANNKALEKVTGDYWCIVNSDDILLPGAINKVVNEISNNKNIKWLAGGFHYIDENDTVTNTEIPVKPNVSEYSFFHRCWIAHPTVFLHKDLIAEIGYFEKYHSMDLNYWLRLDKAGYEPYLIKDYIAGLRFHNDCKSTNLIKSKEEVIKVFEDFMNKEKLTDKKEILSLLKIHKIKLNKFKLSHAIVSKDKTLNKLLIEAVKLDPAVIFKKWFLGIIKRRLFGLDKNDKLILEFEKTNSNNANWNDL